jgi:hypothetical protein
MAGLSQADKETLRAILSQVTIPGANITYEGILESDTPDKVAAIQKAFGITLDPAQQAAVLAMTQLGHNDRVVLAAELISAGLTANSGVFNEIGNEAAKIIHFLFGWL